MLVGVAASRTKISRNQNHRFQSKFAYCKLFGVYAGVIYFVRDEARKRGLLAGMGRMVGILDDTFWVAVLDL